VQQKKKILIGYPYWGSGGAEVATMWLIEALKENYNLSLITRGNFHLDKLNLIAGTDVKTNEIKVINTQLKVTLKTNIFGRIWNALYLRMCRFFATDYDLCITGSQTINWGRKAIHILSDAEWNEELKITFGCTQEPKSFLFKIYNWGAKMIEGHPNHLLSNDLYIANSKWTARVSSPYINTKIRVVYPPVQPIKYTFAATRKNNSFLYIGRISPEKRIELAIDILKKIRSIHSNLTLHIAGEIENSAYSRFIMELCNKEDWIFLHGALYGGKKTEILHSCQFYINARASEPFGISTVEAIQSGIIPFAFNDGGQTEIIKNHKLLFSNKDEAHEKISAVLMDKDSQDKILFGLQKQAEEFSSLIFSRHMLMTINEITNEIQKSTSY
jgi:glycosyltransferase involved in cell wall biosynthesis